jgi:hypothetical protein
MNYYCLDCGAVWFGMGDTSGICGDCGGGDVASQSDLTQRYVRECLLPLPEALVTLIGSDDRPFVRWLCEKLSGNLDYQDMILNGPFEKEEASI